MKGSLSKHYSKRRRKIVVSYMDSGFRFHHKTFSDCTLIEASNVYKAFARVFGWRYIGYTTYDY